MTYLVYKHTSPSGKSYIGLTNDYDNRCAAHRAPSSQCKAFAAAIKKYGWDNFTHEILYSGLTKEQACYREQQSINEYGSLAPYGYNLTTGGAAPVICDELRQRASARMKGNNPSAETRLKLSNAARGRTHSEATKLKVSIARKGVPRSESANIKLSHTYILTTPTGEEIVVDRLSIFCNEHGLIPSCLRAVARGAAAHHRGWLMRSA